MRHHRAALAASFAFAVAAWVAAPAHAHGTAEEHVLADSGHVVAAEPRLAAETAAVTAADAQVAAAAVDGLPQDVGSWGPVQPWPVVGVHVALLPNGKVLAYDSVGDRATESFPAQDHTRATVWDPATGSFTPVGVSAFNIFCSGLAHLADGSVFTAGGTLNAQLQGIVQTHVFDPLTFTWARGPDMAAGRWYPTVTPLPNGEMLITEGGPDIPEVRTTAGGLRRLDTAALNLPLYPWIDVAPDGRAFYSGPDPTLRSLRTSDGGAWQTYGQRDAINRTYGGHAMYDIGRILVAGGGPSSADARIIDLRGASPTVAPTAPMAVGRRQHNLTVLADGSVLATGGNSSGAELVDLNAGVYAAELWDPTTGRWTTLAAERTTRQYHSTALLLPDGRVLSSGGGLCDVCDRVGYLGKDAEVFTPPYLFKKDGSGELAPRPTIASAPATASWGGDVPIVTPDAAAIRKVALVRLGAVTHSVNMDQRYVPLAFATGDGVLHATAPSDANVAPPGVYMVFIVDADGVPSVATMVTLRDGRPPAVSLTRPSSGTAFTARATVTLEADASDPDGNVASVEFFRGGVEIGKDRSAPYSAVWAGAAAGTYALSARATDDAGFVTHSASTTITIADAPPDQSVPDDATTAGGTPAGPPAGGGVATPLPPLTPGVTSSEEAHPGAGAEPRTVGTPAAASPPDDAAPKGGARAPGGAASWTLRVSPTTRSPAPWRVRRARATRLLERCRRERSVAAGTCRRRARAGLQLGLRWTVTERAAVEVVLRTSSRARVLARWRADDGLHGAVFVPPRLQRRLQPGGYEFVAVAKGERGRRRAVARFRVTGLA